MIGRDGNWPVAVLNDNEYGTKTNNSKDPKSLETTEKIELIAPSDRSNYHDPPPHTVATLTVATLGTSSDAYYWPKSGRPSPLTWRIALLGIMGLAVVLRAIWRSLCGDI